MTEYLLGGLSPEGREEVEQRVSTSPAWFRAVAAIEDDLIRQWHRGTLDPDARRRFSAAYGATAARRRRVDAEARLMSAIARMAQPAFHRAAWIGAALAVAAGVSALALRGRRRP